MAEALYRKYRPQIFEDVVGQEHIERTIKNAIAQDKLSHAYLFTGPRGTGKTTTARLLAKALLCEKGPTAEPDGTCVDCQMIADGEHPDVYELDAASRTGVENVREEIIGRVQFAPTRGRYKIYIIDEVHMLSTAAFNALLKTLEEPPGHVVFILATTDPQKVPETIHSRCQRFDFRRISLEAIVSRLGAICMAEGVEFEGEALDLVAHRAEGGMRNALTSLEQLIAFGEGKVTLEVAERMLGSLDSSDLAEIVQFVGRRDVASCFRWTAQFVETGADLAQFTRDFAEHVRNMYVMSLAGADVALEVGEAARRELAAELSLFGPDRLARLLGVLGDLSAELKTSTNPRLSFEIALTRMVRPDSDLTLESLAERIEALEAAGPVGLGACSPIPVQASIPVQAPVSEAAPTREPIPEQPRMQAQVQAQAPTQVQVPTQVQAQCAVQNSVQAQAQTQSQVQSQVSTQVQAPTVSSVGVGRAELKNPAVLQRMWQSALATLKKEKAAYGVLFLNTKAIYDEARDCLAVEFPAENTFAFKAVQKPDIQHALDGALTKAAGASLPFCFVQAGSGSVHAAQPASASASAPAQPQPQPAVASEQPQPAQPQPAQPQTAVASEQPQPAQPQPQPMTAAPQVASYDEPDDDRVPLDVYDGYVAYDEPDDYYAASTAVTPTSLPADALSGATPPLSPTPSASPASPSPVTQTGDQEADLQAILAQSFGSGVVLEEVKE